MSHEIKGEKGCVTEISFSIVYNSTAQLTPRMVSITAWDWGSVQTFFHSTCIRLIFTANRAKAAYFWLGFNVSVTIWCYFVLPETRNLSYSELDVLFGNKISARKFTHVVVHDEAAAGDGKIVQETEHLEHGQFAIENEKNLSGEEVGILPVLK